MDDMDYADVQQAWKRLLMDGLVDDLGSCEADGRPWAVGRKPIESARLCV